MSRTLGFFLGSAAVFALLVLILGQPVQLAPPASRDYLPTGTRTASIPVQVPVPQDPPAQGPATQPETATARTVPQSAMPLEAAAETPLPPATDSVNAVTVSEPVVAPVVVEYQDENQLAETWLAGKSEQPSVANTGAVDKPMSLPEAAPVDLPGQGQVEEPESAPDEPAWYPLWDPFHSELSANAFARRLERITGLDYRVVKTAPAQYRVLMAYETEEQRNINLSLIEEATGLVIAGGSL